jgi:hypothetical protein
VVACRQRCHLAWGGVISFSETWAAKISGLAAGRAFVLSAVLALACLLSFGTRNAPGAGRPPAPVGVHQLAPGQLPTVCTGADVGSGESSVSGAYYDGLTNSWISAPFCYPRWGNLEASPPQIAATGLAVTVTATPNGGSNSQTYAPQTKTISWTGAPKPVSGCGAVDLTCTFIPAPDGASVWRWFEVEVSMPRTFFIDSPGEFCAGMPVCAGVETHAWTWIGVPPGCARPLATGAARTTESRRMGRKVTAGDSVRAGQPVAQSSGTHCRNPRLVVQGLPTGSTPLAAGLEKLPVRLKYEGDGWDPKGGRIVVTWPGAPRKTFPAAAGFHGVLLAAAWPQRDNALAPGRTHPAAGCSGTLTARQGSTTRTQRVSTRLVGAVIFADANPVFHSGDVVCGGEEFTLEHTSGTVVLTDTTNGMVFYIFQNGKELTPGTGVIAAKGLCIALVPRSRGHVSITRSTTSGAYDVARVPKC